MWPTLCSMVASYACLRSSTCSRANAWPLKSAKASREKDVVCVLNQVVSQRGLPRTVKSDNGSEFISNAMDKWAYERGVELDFSRPGKPTDNAAVESFNGRLRQECLNAHWFSSWADAPEKRLRFGDRTTTRTAPTRHQTGLHPLTSPAAAACRPQRRFPRSRKFLLPIGTESGAGASSMPHGRDGRPESSRVMFVRSEVSGAAFSLRASAACNNHEIDAAETVLGGG